MKKGITLIEITLTILILIIVTAGIVKIFSHSSVISTESREIYIAVQAAQEKMELIRDMDFSTIIPESSFTTPGFVYLNNPLGAVSVSNYDADGDGTDDNEIKKVTVTIKLDLGGKQKFEQKSDYADNARGDR